MWSHKNTGRSLISSFFLADFRAGEQTSREDSELEWNLAFLCSEPNGKNEKRFALRQRWTEGRTRRGTEIIGAGQTSSAEKLTVDPGRRSRKLNAQHGAPRYQLSSADEYSDSLSPKCPIARNATMLPRKVVGED